MSSFQSKLNRLPGMGPRTTRDAPAPEREAEADPAPETSPEGAPEASPEGSWSAPARPSASGGPPSLDELRDRIVRILARTSVRPPPANPAATELPFVHTETASGPLYLRRERALPAARVGRVPLVGARDADPALLALLALDPGLSGCDPRRALYLDTETTGLSGGTGTVPFLLGLSWFDPDAGVFVIEQVLLRRLGEEAPILELLAERIASASMIVTYNGKAFDMPLLRTRFIMNRLPAPKEPPHLDLVHVARRIHGTRLRSRTLVSIEHLVLGRARVDDVAGGDIVSTYLHFLRTGDEGALAGVVEHNAADVLAMVALVGLYGESAAQTSEDDARDAESSLPGEDLAGIAATMRRAGQLDRATVLADIALARGGGAAAHRAIGDIAKARGDKARALRSFEALAAEVDDARVRLELCKLYEHHARDFASALAFAEKGTGEHDEAAAKRRARLVRKLTTPTAPKKAAKKRARGA